MTYLLAATLLVVTNFGLWTTRVFPGWVLLVSMLIMARTGLDESVQDPKPVVRCGEEAIDVSQPLRPRDGASDQVDKEARDGGSHPWRGDSPLLGALNASIKATPTSSNATAQ